MNYSNKTAKVVRTTYALTFNGKQTFFPSLDSLNLYISDFTRQFPDVDTEHISVYRMDLYELKTSEQ